MRIRTTLAALGLATAAALVPAAPADAAGACWIESQTPTRYGLSVGSGGVIARGSNHCSPPSTVLSIRVELQKRSGFWPFYSWKRVAGGSTIYASPGQLDIYSSAQQSDYFCTSGTFRTFTYGTANATSWQGAQPSGSVRLSC